jgi:hypothetical protein
MKGMVVYLKHIGTALILLGLLAGCEFFIGPEITEGNITIQLGLGNSGAKAVFSPAEIADFHYVAEAQKTGGAALTPQTFPKGTEQINLTLGLGEWTVTIKAYDLDDVLKATGRKTVTVTPEGSVVHITMRSSNANLSSLIVTVGQLHLEPAFSPNTTEYTMVGLFAFDSSIDITAITSDPDATITINEEPTSSGTKKTIDDLTMFGGKVTVTIVVTAQDGMTTKTYTVMASRNLL